MRTLAIILLLAPLAVQAGSVLGGSVSDGIIASNQAKKINTAPVTAPAPTALPPGRTDRDRTEARRRAEDTFEEARRENERRRLLGIP